MTASGEADGGRAGRHLCRREGPLCLPCRPPTPLTRAAWLRPLGERKPFRRNPETRGRAHRPPPPLMKRQIQSADDADAYMEIK